MFGAGFSKSSSSPVFVRRVVEFSSSFGFPRNKQVPDFFQETRYLSC